MRVLAICGPKRSGKNTLADMVADAVRARDGRELHLHALADPIRWAADAAGFPLDATRDGKDAPCALLGGRPGRDFLIMLGLGGRSLSPTLWLDLLLARLDAAEAADPDACAAVTDVRFLNEVEGLDRWASAKRSRAAAALWVERPGFDADEVLEHALRDRCGVICNAGDLADLRRRAGPIAEWATTRSRDPAVDQVSA